MLQNIETTVQSYQRMSNKNIKKGPGIEGALCNCMGKIRNYNFGYQNSSFFKSFCFVLNWQKDIWCRYAYSCTSPPIWASMLLDGPPLCHSEHAYSMDDPQRNLRTGPKSTYLHIWRHKF